MVIKEIPAKLNKNTGTRLDFNNKKRVCGYARVSTDLNEQKTSYKAQLDYYTKYITGNPEWKFIKLYADRGITGTKTAPRTGFMEMLKDAKNGKIDMIVTKSISRFARNTVDSLKTLRELREIGVDVYFERENFHTLDEDSELLLSIISGVAQEESHSISENTKWGIRKKFLEGDSKFSNRRMYGYTKDAAGDLIINKEEAQVVKLIFNLFLDGYSSVAIAKKLVELKHKNIKGLCRWTSSTIIGILRNEKYKGDSILQKTFSKDFISKRSVINTGELPRYEVKDDHEKIIERGVFDLVQYELKNRELDRNISRKTVLSSRIYCGLCGAPYGRKTYTINGKRTIAYLCNDKRYTKCKNHQVLEADIIKSIIEAINYTYDRKEEIIRIDNEKIKECSDIDGLLTQKATLENALYELRNEINTLIADIDFCRNTMDSETMKQSKEHLNMQKQKYDELNEQVDKKCNELTAINNKITEIKCKELKIERFIDSLKFLDRPVKKYNETLCAKLIDRITVQSEMVDILFKDGRAVML